MHAIAALQSSASAEDHKRFLDLDVLARFDVDGLDRAVSIGRDLVLHLHGLEDEQHIAGLDALAFFDEDLATWVSSSAAFAASKTGDSLIFERM